MLPTGDLLHAPNIGLVCAVFLFYLIGGAVYRLYLHPLAKFPGPRIAALTLWYEFYYDVVKGGKYTWEIGQMHRRYGPIVRINPYELHIDEPDYYDELYSGSGKKRDKWEWSAKMFGNSTSMLGTVPHDHHRLRRSALNPYFSKRSVARLEPMIHSVVEKLCRRLTEFESSQKPVNLGFAYAALTMDIITEYSFAKSFNNIDAPDFAPEWPAVIDAVSEASHLNKQFGWLLPLMKMMPESMVARLNPQMLLLINFQKDLARQIQTIIDAKNDVYGSDSHPTIFHELINSDLPANEKSVARLTDEGQTIIAAGQVTTAHYLKMTSYHILANSKILQKLKAELTSAMPKAESLASLTTLEQLPYLSAVVSEGYRMSYGVTSRLQRVSPETPLTFHEWVIPAGTPVGMTSIFMHENPKYFPNPREFRPERWLNTESRNRLEKYLVNFSKGTRSCLGLNLAHAEIYLTLAAVFRRFDLQLYKTTRDDVDIVHDFFNPAPQKGSEGVRVIVNQAEKTIS